MKLRARVVKHMGVTTHRLADVVKGDVIPGEPLPNAASVEIVQDDSGVFLFHYDAAGVCVADTWHATVSDAKRQAKFEFGIEEGDWIQIADGGNGP